MLRKEEKQEPKVINGINTKDLKDTIEEIKMNPALGQCQFRLKNEWISADENKSVIHDYYAAGSEQTHQQKFEFTAGEPPLLAGNDKGANPVEFLLTALSSCMTTTIAYYAALNGYKIEEMESDFNGELDLQGLFGLDKTTRPGYQKIDVRFKIKTDVPIAELETFYQHSPVYDVVSKSVPVEVTIETD